MLPSFWKKEKRKQPGRFSYQTHSPYFCAIRNSMQSAHLSEQEIVRREKLAELRKLGIDPYPAALYPVNAYSTEIKNQFKDEDKEKFNNVCLAGRIMSVRDMGKASFAVLQDSHGRIQLYVRKDD